jgi:DNA-binding CsgD family transcriptional regulator/tetratricopeptide (TPR) repeat protein
MGASTGVFVGREAEADLVSSALKASRESTPRIVSIEGEPGIGKTAFLRRILAKAEDVVVLEASGDESEVALDYGVVLQLFSRATSVSSGAALNDGVVGPSSASVFSVGAELLAMLGDLQDRAAVVVAVDDAHWMDLSSAGALLFALRRLYADRVLVLLASRADGLDRLGSSWLRLLDDSERAQRVRLGGLNAREVSLLAASLGFGSLTLASAERLREHTGGHPLYVKALLGELPPGALAFEPGPLPAPHSYAATVVARLTNVDSDTQDLVAAAAVAGNRCPLTLAGLLSGVSEPLAALEDAIAADLLALVPARIPEEVTFPHPLVRAAVYDDLSPSRRRRLHLACAELTSGSASLPHRVAASPGSDDALAAELAASGEDQAARGNLTAAAEHLLSGSRIAASRKGREGALLRAVECLVLAGELPRALGLRDAVLSCADGPHRSFIIGLLVASVGRVAEAEAALRDVIDRPDFADCPELFGPVIASLAVVCALRGRGDEAVKWARRALQRKGSLATTEVIATQALAWGLSAVGRGREGIAVFDSLSPARMRPEPFEAELLTVRGNLKAWWGDLLGAVEDLSAVIRWSREGAPLRSLPNAYGALAEVEYRIGRWDDGLTHAEVAVSLAEDTDRAWELPFVHAVASYLHAGRGNRSFAAEHAEAARRVMEVAPVPLSRYYACVAAAHLAWVREDWDTVLDSLAPLHKSGRAIGMTGLERVPWLLEAEAMIRTDRLEQAARVLDGVDAAMGDSAHDVARIDLWRLRGSLEHAHQRPANARAAFLEGRAAAKTAHSPLAQATLELAYGHFLHKTGRRREAIAALRVAGELFERLGARPFSERCDVELAACGVRARPDGADDQYGLTAREQVVARLVASGKSNREVAAELYLSRKAIEYHLANIFTKVGIRSRHQLASRLAGSSTKNRPGSSQDALAGVHRR